MITSITGFFILYLGIYVYHIHPRAKIQKHFLFLCVMLCSWMVGYGMRLSVPSEYREIYSNWILLPIPFIPLFLEMVVYSIAKIKYSMNTYQTIMIFVLLPTFSIISFCGGYARIDDMSGYSFVPLFNYHLLTIFCFISVIKISFDLGFIMFKKRGDERIRSFLMLSGILIALLFAIIFCYILPLNNIFLGVYSAFGLLIFAILWSVAILHYDAFEIRELVIEGAPTPILSRIFSFCVLGLYRIMDGHGYHLKLIASKALVTMNIADKHFDLAIRYPTLERLERAKLVADIYNRRIR